MLLMPLRRAREGAGTGTSQKTCLCGMPRAIEAARERFTTCGERVVSDRFPINSQENLPLPLRRVKCDVRSMISDSITIAVRRAFVLLAFVLLLPGCMNYGPPQEERFDFGPASGKPQEGVFILNEGRFTYGEATLSYYIPGSGELENEVFARANGIKLGDVAQSVTMRGDMLYIVVNNSGVVFAADRDTFALKGLLRGIASPRHIHFVSEEKAYITSLYDNKITVFDPRTLSVTGHIPTGDHHSTEQMAAFGKWLFVTCWSYDDTVLVVDTDTDTVTAEIKTGIQPKWAVVDKHGKLWVLTDGGYSTSSYGHEPPVLYRIDAATHAIEKEFCFTLGDSPKGLALDPEGGTLYFLNRHLYRMDAEASELPASPLYAVEGETLFYSLGIAPDGEIYLGDAIDYSQRGVVHRLGSDGRLIEKIRTGIIPAAFCFKTERP